MISVFLKFNQPYLNHQLFSILQRWLLTAKVKETTVVISLQTSQMQDQCKYVQRGKAQNVFSIYGHFPLPVFGNGACHRHDRPLTRPAVSSRKGPIQQPKSSLYKLVQLRFSWGHRARCFLGDLRQH